MTRSSRPPTTRRDFLKTSAGLAACYAAAIPFFQNTVAGDLFYAVLLFGGFALAKHFVPQLRAGEPQPA